MDAGFGHAIVGVVIAVAVVSGIDSAEIGTDGIRAIVAFNVSLLVEEETITFENVAEPDKRLAVCVPVRNPALSCIEIEPTTKLAAAPLSVNCTTGAGDIAAPTLTAENGSVLKASE